MKKLKIALLGSSLLLAHQVALAGETFAIKAFGRPQVQTMTGSVTAASIDVKTVAPINCNGTSTSSARIYIAPNATTTDLSVHNSGFIGAAEIINAAKLGLALETAGTLAYDVNKGGCNIKDYWIYVL